MKGRADWSSLFLEIIIAALFAKFGDELTGGSLQRGSGPAFTSQPVSAREAAAELAYSGDDKVSQSLVGKGGDEFVQLGWGQTPGQCVEAVRFRPNVGIPRWRKGLGLLAGFTLPNRTRFGFGGCRYGCCGRRCGCRGWNAEEICLSRVGCWLLCHVLIPPDQPTLMRHGSDVAAFGLKREGWARRRALAPGHNRGSRFCPRRECKRAKWRRCNTQVWRIARVRLRCFTAFEAPYRLDV